MRVGADAAYRAEQRLALVGRCRRGVLAKAKRDAHRLGERHPVADAVRLTEVRGQCEAREATLDGEPTLDLWLVDDELERRDRDAEAWVLHIVDAQLLACHEVVAEEARIAIDKVLRKPLVASAVPHDLDAAVPFGERVERLADERRDLAWCQNVLDKVCGFLAWRGIVSRLYVKLEATDRELAGGDGAVEALPTILELVAQRQKLKRFCPHVHRAEDGAEELRGEDRRDRRPPRVA